MQNISPWIRFLSTIADVTVLRLFLDIASIFIPTSLFTSKTVILTSFLGAVFLTYFISRIFLNGQTIGMWMFGYHIRKNTKGKRLTWLEEVLRFISQGISVLLLFLPFLYVFFNKKSVHLSDAVVDSSPNPAPMKFEKSRPFQKLIGVLLLAAAITSIPMIFNKVPAVDLFARIFKGEIARMICIGLVICSATFGVLSVVGWKWAAHLVAAFYLIMVVSAVWSIFDINAYQRRVSQNLKETLNLAHAQSPTGISAKMLNSLIADADNNLQKNLLPAAKFGLVTNLIPLAYMIYLLFSARVDLIIKSVLDRIRASGEKIIGKIRLSYEERFK